MQPPPSHRDPRPIVLAGLLAAGALVRGAYAWGYAGLPFASGPIGDSPVYLRQAAAVLDGRHGDAALLAMSPLPGYFIALFGARPELVIAAQLVLGLSCALLLARLTRRALGETAAVGAVALYLGYGLFPFYETKLLGETLGFALALGSLQLALEAPRRRRGWTWALAAGALMAAAVLARASLLFAALLLPLGALAAARTSEPWRPRLARVGGVLGGLALVFTTRGLLTLAHAGTFVAVLYTAPGLEGARELRPADASAETSVVGARPVTAAPHRTAWEMVDAVEARLASGAEAPPLLDTARAIDLAAVLSRAPVKLAETFRDLEASYQYAYYGERAHLPALNVHPVTFPLVALLALFGAVAVVRRGDARLLALFLPLVLGTLVTTVLYMPIARYRMPMLAALLPLGGAGIDALIEGVRARRPVAGVGVLLALLVLIPTAWRNVRYESHHPERWHLVLAESYASQRPPNREEVRAELDRAVASLRARGEPITPAFVARGRAILEAAGMGGR